ncbi:hypothetical protein [Sinorhizobium chiapasense]|uniref:Phage ABA sandwich domain-containing protein n=1 Tax=Sinorhizobium chiapasense TaxID=501572 RepID=A0ABZ2BMZ8_9HYPH
MQLLQTATNPARSLDVAIGTAIGWRKSVKKIPDTTGQMKDVAVWIVPNSDDAGKMPFYTSNLKHAVELAEQIAPNNVGGCSWSDGLGTARIDDGPYFQACNPQIALCLAALHCLKINQEP